MKEMSYDGKGKKVHLVRPISFEKVKAFARNIVSMPKSVYRRLSNSSKKKIKAIKIERKPGRPISIDPKKIEEIIRLYKLAYSYREIERETNIPKSTVHYLIKKAKKSKIKVKGKIYALD